MNKKELISVNEDIELLGEKGLFSVKEANTNSGSDSVQQFVGSCLLTIHAGVDLVNKDVFGKSDPYVVVEYGGNKYRSKVEKNNLNPDWNFSTEIEVDSSMSDEIYINVFDEDIGRDDAI